MARSVPLPAALPDAFTVAQGVAAGLAPSRLRSGGTPAPFHGVRVRAGVATTTLRQRCAAYAPRLTAAQFFSHETALALVGAPMPEWPYVPGIHVSAHRPAREPRTSGIRGHRLQTREPATITSAGVRCEHPVRAWRQAGRLWALGDLVAAADFLIAGDAPLASLDELRAEIAAMGDMSGSLLMRALRRSRYGVRSARETRLRLLLEDAGLPQPETGWNLRDERGAFVAELDLAYPRYRVGVEYDGRVHAESIAQFERDADRWDAIRSRGWSHCRILSHHLRAGGRPAIQKVAEALIAAGWSSGR